MTKDSISFETARQLVVDLQKLNEYTVKRIEAQGERIKELENELAQQKRDFEGRVTGVERTAQYDYENFWEMPRLLVGAVCMVCLGMGLVLWENSDKLQEIGMLKEFVGMYLFLCIFGLVACIFAFWVDKCKQHTIDYLQHLKTPQKHV